MQHQKETEMRRKITYWGATGLVTIVPLLAAFAYLTAAPQAVENFRHVGYPQQLRVLLGIRSDYVLGSDGSRDDRAAARRLCLLDRGPPGGRELPPRGISAAVACPARHQIGLRIGERRFS